jgi:hypothetical protein
MPELLIRSQMPRDSSLPPILSHQTCRFARICTRTVRRVSAGPRLQSTDAVGTGPVPGRPRTEIRPGVLVNRGTSDHVRNTTRSLSCGGIRARPSSSPAAERRVHRLKRAAQPNRLDSFRVVP